MNEDKTSPEELADIVARSLSESRVQFAWDAAQRVCGGGVADTDPETIYKAAELILAEYQAIYDQLYAGFTRPGSADG